MEWLALVLFVAICGALMLGYPVALTLAGVSLLFAWLGQAFGVFDGAFLTAIPNRLFGIMTNATLIAVPLFVFMGVVLEKSQVAERLLVSVAKLFGKRVAGMGLAVILVGALLAASTGIVGATVVTMGLMALPVMLRQGYAPSYATGVIAATGTLGQIIPPSIALVLLGDVLSSSYQQAQMKMGIFNPKTVSVGDLFAGAMLPGLVLVVLYVVYTLVLAKLKPQQFAANTTELTLTKEPSAQTQEPSAKTQEPSAKTKEPSAQTQEPPAQVTELPRTPSYRATQLHEHTSESVSLLQGLFGPLLLIATVLGSILTGKATPTEASAVGAFGALLLAIWHRKLTFGMLKSVCQSTANITSMVFLILIGASIFSLVFRGFGGEQLVEDIFAWVPGGPFGATLLVMVLIFALGFILDFIEITFVVVPIVAPVLFALGVDPIWLGIMIAVNLQTSFLTPPFGFALFYLRGVTPSTVSTGQMYRGVVPFIGLQLLLLVLLWAWPSLATWLPHQLYG